MLVSLGTSRVDLDRFSMAADVILSNFPLEALMMAGNVLRVKMAILNRTTLEWDICHDLSCMSIESWRSLGIERIPTPGACQNFEKQ